MNEHYLFTLLKKKYQAPAFVVVPQVGNSTGFGRNRTADAIIVSTWPSRGLWLAGCEMKCSRSDWLRELKEPAKAESICQFCDYWWVVVTNADFVKDGELPETWGLMSVKVGANGNVEKNTLQVIKEAPRLKPKPYTPAFLAAIMRQAAEVVVPRADIEKEIKEALEQGRREGRTAEKKRLESEQQRLDYEQRRTREAIQAFEEKSGIKFSEYCAGDIGKAVKYVMAGGVEKDLADLRKIVQVAGRLKDVATEQLELLGESEFGFGVFNPESARARQSLDSVMEVDRAEG